MSKSQSLPAALNPVTIQKKLKIMSDLFHFAFTIKKEQLKRKFPNLSEQELKKKTYALIEKGCR
ncbi:MAG: hypothetical protein HQK50_16435 [Oligoflexia bacterium]|nr:hypothetical protein [Oligoflexia bacterium]MBF0367165.1 hypothetical protein [Oligoflexia bacterium]